MSDLREAHDPEREPQIDTVGWLFLALAVAITAAAGMVVLQGQHDGCECPCVTGSCALATVLPQ